MRIWLSIFLGGLLLSFGCGRKEIKVPAFDEKNAMRLLVKLVAFGPRSAGTEANLKQAEFIAKTAEEYGAVTVRQRFEQHTRKGLLRFFNIEATVPGRRSEFIIIGSHFDSKELPENIKFEGANDGASSTAVLLEIIRTIKSSGVTPEYTLKFVFFDGEECFDEYGPNDGLFGSKYYARDLKTKELVKKCRAVIVLDMVGDRDLGIRVPADSDRQLCKMLFAAAEKTGNRKYFSYFHSALLDDHVPFQKLGIPVIDIIDFEFGPGNAFWHTSEDNLKNVSPESLKIVGKTALSLIFNEI